MLNFTSFRFQANSGYLPGPGLLSHDDANQTEVDSYPVWGGPVVQPDYQQLRDTFSTSTCHDSSLNAMRDLARQLGPVRLNKQAPNSEARRRRDTEAKKAKPETDSAPKVRKVDLKSMTEAEKYDYYKAMIEENGGKFRDKPGRRNLLSLRHNTNTRANHKQGRYDDVTVMLWTDKKGGKHVRRYRSNTEPSARFEGVYGKDANGDGRLDQVRVKAGYNEYYVSKSDRLGNVLRPSRATRGEVDVNHDGRFNKADGKRRFTSGDYSMLFHAGGETGTGSAGCQTMPPEVFERFWRDLNRGGKQGRIGYTIVDLPA